MKIKTSVSLSEDLVRGMDALLKEPGLPDSRSAFLEAALRRFIADLERRMRDANDMEVLNRRSRKFNKEAADVLAYQTDL